MIKKSKKSPDRPVLAYAGKSPAAEVLSGYDRAPTLTRCANSTGSAASSPASSPVAAGRGSMLISGDNMCALRALLRLKKDRQLTNADGTPGARLIYIDPPFSSRQTYRTRCKRTAYEDRLSGADFIEFLRRRLILLRELLADDGSIYIHLDWKMAHHIKVVMDELFGADNFLNDIIWHYGGRGAKAVSGQFSRNHDTLLLYRKKRHIFNRLYTKEVIGSRNGVQQDSDGRWFKTAPRGDYTDESIRRLSGEGRIHITKNRTVRIKYFLEETPEGVMDRRPVSDVWSDIPDAMHMARSEKTGYPTQKPEALLARIVKTSSNPGDLVLDAFSGSGTTLVVAEKLQRRWVGIDSGGLAIETTRKRLEEIAQTAGFNEERKGRYAKACAPYLLLKAAPGAER